MDGLSEPLDFFRQKVRDRELEERSIQLDRATYRADHAKDEYNELTAMYSRPSGPWST